ncbi:copper resistance system multicopper oxidase [Marinobacterium arenosum]|uniref:copper resistance system multicopper oxidase n=1 Tax=Marinobacterium arenosum TaxID=2862496 RepID=UPI001C973C72|nr:copper resistance system multicopper oxidase [Marinobacterium arenosum]MBY4677585.1 copper resistance system multicopper oxidase [Marinobacterium arenosum]
MKNINLNRRQFVQGLALGGVVAGLGVPGGKLLAAPAANQQPPLLSGNRIDLTIGAQRVDFTGRSRFATTVNNSLPAPTLRLKQGEEVTLRVTNRLRETSSIHWHGLILPTGMDGVPGISFDGIPPGETFIYHFKVQQSGTYWYHSHSGFQEQTGLYGPIIIDPLEPEPFSYDRDYVVMLSDWSDENPHAIYAKLKKLSHYYNFNERTLDDTLADLRRQGAAATWRDRSMWERMRMSDRDLSDVTGYTYTFLMNGQTPMQGWQGLFKRGERVRLRFINGAAMTFFDVRIPGLKMTVVAADGQNVEPVSVDEFRIGVAETYDVIVEPSDQQAYCVFAQAIDRSGYARGTLTPDAGLTAPVPPMDPLPILSHADMGMANGGHVMAGGGHQGHDMKAMQMDHSGHQMPIDHSRHGMMAEQAGHDMAAMSPPATPQPTAPQPVKHAATEYGPHVDMRAENPQYRLDDPGVGLRNNGRRVLSYADLRNLNETRDRREPQREIELHLTGNMSRYMWSINGVKFADAEPIKLNYGERLRFTFVNDTMMNHPMHLHGMWSELESGDDRHLPRKHTVVVQPGTRISYQVTADAPGKWAFHCHLLYHMPGMFREVHVI